MMMVCTVEKLPSAGACSALTSSTLALLMTAAPRATASAIFTCDHIAVIDDDDFDRD